MTHIKWTRHLLAAISLLFLLSGVLSPGPEIQNLSLTATSPGNLTTDDLICSYDLAGTATTAATAWYKDASPLMALFMPFEGGPTNALFDYSGNGHTASANGSLAWNATAGNDGHGTFEFDGVNDYLVVPDAAALDVDYVTLAAWIYIDSFPNDPRIISKEYGTTEPYSIYTLMLNGDNEDKLELRIGVAGTRYRLIGNTAIPGSQWVHIAGTYDGNNMKIYVNGQVDTTLPLGGVLMKNTNSVWIGASEFYGRFFNGRIDDARVYDHALSPEQILALHSTGPNVIKYNETDIGELWQARVTPFSSTEVELTYESNTIAIEVDSVPPVITSTAVTEAFAGWLYSYNVNATGYPVPTYSLLTYPTGMTIDSASGLIEWTPTAAGSEPVTVQASNNEGTDQQNFTIVVQESLVVVRINPLGNSITYDNHTGDTRPPEERISYRYPLWQLLTNAGYDFDFVGTLSAGGSYFPDPENDGRPGWTDTQIADSVYTFLQRNPTDIVLLHIGTNGLTSSPDDVEDILNEIDRFETDYSTPIWVILARIINRSSYSSTTTAFNDNVEAMALARTSDQIVIVDMEDGAGIDYRLQPLGDMWDNLHPNDDGYEKMANVWFAALQNLLPTPSPLVCPPDMTHYWKMDDASGSPYNDVRGSNDAQATNEPALASGIVAGAQEFNGTDDEVTVPDDNTFDWGATGSFTIEFWMKKDTPCSGPDINDNNVIVGRDDASTNLHWWVGITCAYTPQGVTCFQLRDDNGNGAAIYGSTVITNGAWHHIVAVRDGGADRNRIYVDGVKEDSLLYDYTSGFGSTVDLDIGYLNLAPYYHYDGVVDEIATYDRALSNDEVLAHYLGGLIGEGYCADVEVASAPAIISTPNTEATVLQSYTYDVNASGYPIPTYNLLSFPAGMTINSLTGLIEWMPTAAGDVLVTVEAINSEGTDNQSFTLYVTEPPVCPSGMVSYWKFDETSGTSYDDYYNGNDGQASASAPTPSGDGVVGGSQDFNGSSNRITIADDPAFDWALDSSFTIEVWAKFTNVDSRNKVMIGRDDGGGGHPHWWLGATQSTGTTAFILMDTNANGASLSGTTAINNNQWHHLVAVRDESVNRNRLYVDGVKVDSVTHDYTAGFEATTTLGIGYMAYNGTPDYFYDGLLDELAIYDRSLSDVEILAHYTNGMSGEGYCSEDSIAPTIISTPVTDARAGELYTYDVNASGLPAPTYALTVFPTGMTIDALSGVIEWIPATPVSTLVTVVANNSEGSDDQSFTIVVEEALTCPTSMTHYWMFEETSGPPYEDYYAGNDATCANCPAPATGIIGGALQFNGTDDEVNVTDDNTWDWGKDDSFSIAYWMKTSASTSGNRVIVARDDLVNSLHWWVGCDDSGKVRFQLRDINGNGAYIGNIGIALNNGVWHFVVAVRDNSANMNRIYVDGAKIDSAYHDYTAGFVSNVPLNIGYINLSHHYRYEGIVDEIATFDAALTDAEVLSYYNDGLVGDGYCAVDSIAPAITSTPVTDATVGQLYTYDVDATGYPAPTYALTVFPSGMTIGSADGVITWTPTSAGNADVTVEASNAKGTDNQNFTVVVEEAPVCPPGMISYWKLDETGGATYGDFYNGNDGTGSVPAPTPSAGLIGGAQDFNGTNNYITVDDDPSFDWAYDASFTIEVWAKFTNVNAWNKVMIGRDDGGGGQPHWWLGAQQLTGHAFFNLLDATGSGDYLSDSKAINDNQWHQVVAVRDENVDMNRLYVDGVKVDSVFYNYTGGFEATTTLGIGYMAYNSTPNYFYDGLLDEIALYGRALSDGEIQTHYAAGKAGQGYCEQYILTAITVGDGSVEKSPDKSSYSYGDTVIVTALPDAGWLFDNWSGGLSGSENPDTIMIVSDTTVTCTFSEDPTGIGDTPSVRVLTLLQNTPNPYNQGTFVEYGLPRGTNVTFGVYDIAGRRVFEKRLSDVPAGWNRFFFDGKDLNGRSLATGVYFYRLKTPVGARVGKMVIIR